jgi:hypothetical protein
MLAKRTCRAHVSGSGPPGPRPDLARDAPRARGRGTPRLTIVTKVSTRRGFRLYTPSVLTFVLSACTGVEPLDSSVPIDSDSDLGEVDAATVPLGGACAMSDDLGGFLIQATEDATDVDGAVANGVVPASVLEEIAASGECSVLRRNNPFCDPSCDPGQACTFEGTCIEYPANQDLGTVTLSGLSEPVVMERVYPGNTYFNTSLVHPAFVGGELLSLAMPGGVYGPATLYGVGVEALDMTGVTWTIEDGLDLALSWPAPTGALVRSEIAVQVSIDQHGVTPSVVRCTFADTGSGVVPAAIVSTLVGAGVTGFPAGSITRRTVDHADVSAGCLDFTVSAPRTVAVDVVGSTPCVSDRECPDGQSCNLELQICE